MARKPTLLKKIFNQLFVTMFCIDSRINTRIERDYFYTLKVISLHSRRTALN